MADRKDITFKEFFAPLIRDFTNRRARIMYKMIWALLIPFLILFLMAAPIKSANAALVRIKDIVNFEGVRDNLLIGYGLVVGLNGTGDSLNNAPFTQQSLIGMLDRLGVNVRGQNLNTGNVAAVMVTATLPPFAGLGSRIDVSISAMGDAQSLRGGTLLVTPLMGADGNVYAVAQGPVAIAGFSAGGDAETVTQNVPTSGRIPNGAIIEKEVDYDLAEMRSLSLALRNPDFTTARRIAERINAFLEEDLAHVESSASVRVNLPFDQDVEDNIEEVIEQKRNVIDLIADIEQLTVEPDQIARVVIDESSGIIVMGSEVKINTVAIAQGNLTIRVTESPQVSQPGAFAQAGETVTVPRTNIQIEEDNTQLGILNETLTLQDLVTGLNALGVGPRDIITILQAIKSAGALQAEIEVM